jgi:multidrug resistance efflux pump
MTPRCRRWAQRLAIAATMFATTTGIGTGTRLAFAGEEDDLQRQIETQRAGANDLDRLDDLRAAGDEITLLKSWLDEAWTLRSKHEYDQVREVLDRALTQAELVRQKINAAQLRAQVQKRESELRELRAKVDKARRALQDLMVKKKALEAQGNNS